MNLSRRHLLSLLPATLAGTALLRANDDLATSTTLSAQVVGDTGLGAKPMVLPKALREGSTVGITAPASGVDNDEISDCIGLLKSIGCKVVVGETIKAKRHGYLSSPDNVRAAEFMEFVERTDIDAIVCARGGYGVMRILSMLDFSVIAKNPKIIVGYSDITALLVAITAKLGIVTYHGPVASSTFDPFTKEYFLRTLYNGPTKPSKPDPGIVNSLTFSDSRLVTFNQGVARGRLTGGNLAMIVATLGTPYEIDTTNSILFLEDVSEEPYRIDRMLTQLELAGKLKTVNGIAFGQFKNCEASGRSGIDVSFSLFQVLEEKMRAYGKPVLYGLPFGHVKSKMVLPLGIEAELNVTEKSFSVLEPPVTCL